MLNDWMMLQSPTRLGDDEGAAKWMHRIYERLVDIGLKSLVTSPFIDEHGHVLLGIKANPEEASRIRAALLN